MKRTDRLAILNGFGRSLGDGIIGLQALYALQCAGRMPKPTLFRESHGRVMVDQLYPLAHDIADVAATADFDAALFDHIIDIRDFAFDPRFRGVAMIDFFLARLGADPGSVAPALKRNTWLAPRLAPQRPAGLPDRYILLCPGASMALRDMPQAVQLHLTELMLRLQPLPIVTQGPASRPAVIAQPEMASIDLLAGLVAGASAIVSTDTAMVHLADAFAVPCLAFFTTHRSEWRVRDYPDCTPVQVPVDGLPDALEFSRGDQDLQAVRTGWARFMPSLDATITAFLSRATSAHIVRQPGS